MNDRAFEHLRTVLLIVSVLFLAACAFGQDHTRTVYQRTPGERSLHLTGIFEDADTAYIQVYHDGLEVAEIAASGTWHLELGAYTTYTIKFTDTRGREKRIAVHELSDDLTEFYPPIEIDFNRAGNLVLIKASSGKPDWIEYDVGMSRRASNEPPRR